MLPHAFHIGFPHAFHIGFPHYQESLESKVKSELSLEDYKVQLLHINIAVVNVICMIVCYQSECNVGVLC